MKKILSLLLIASLLLPITTRAQDPLTLLINDAKSYTNANIQTNLTRAITPQKLNIAVNKLIDALYFIDSAGRFKMDTALVLSIINDTSNSIRTLISSKLNIT